MGRPEAVLVAVVLGLTLGAAELVALDCREPPGQASRAAAFHRLVGGWGLGPVMEPGSAGGGFDPRACPAEAADTGPIPAGAAFQPFHANPALDEPAEEGDAHAAGP